MEWWLYVSLEEERNNKAFCPIQNEEKAGSVASPEKSRKRDCVCSTDLLLFFDDRTIHLTVCFKSFHF